MENFVALPFEIGLKFKLNFMRENKLSLVILSAGIGRRFGGLKQIKPVGPSGEVILDYSVYDAIRAGFSRIVFVIRKEIEKDFRRIVGNYWENRIKVKYAFQEVDSFLPTSLTYSPRKKPWGTAHALLVCKDILNSPFAVINADDFYGFEALNLAFSALSILENEYILIAYRLKDTLSPHGHVSRAICETDENSYLLNLTEIHRIEKKEEGIFAYKDSKIFKLTGKEQVSMNLFGFTPSIFYFLESGFRDFLREKGNESEAEFLLPEIIGKLVKENIAKVRVIPTSSPWFGVTHPEDLEFARNKIRELIEAGEYPKKIKAD